MRDPYATLGIAPGASLDEAEEAYYRLLRLEHPDLHQGSGPDRVARAEQRTRELNAAISALRDGAARRAGAAAGARRAAGAAAGASGPTAGGAAAGSRRAGEHGNRAGGDPFATAGDPFTRTYAAPRPTVDCPWCGEPFARQTDLKGHVLTEHDLRLDPRARRRRLLGGRVHRLLRAAAHLPLWAVIPLNVLLALVVALLVTIPTDEALGLWAGLVAMAPTVAALLESGFDATR